MNNLIVFLSNSNLIEWDYVKNELLGLDPNKLATNSSKKAHFICKNSDKVCKICPHEWITSINKITSGTKCPYCFGSNKHCYHQSFAYLHSNIASEWDYYKNGDLKPEDVKPYSAIKVWWECKNINKECKICKHTWEAKIQDRTRGHRCPYCYGNNKHCYHQSFAYLHPDIASEWDYSKNGDLKPEDFTPHSDKKIWWICKNLNKECNICDHGWQANIDNRVKGRGCNMCKGTSKFCSHQSFGYLYPQLVEKYWHSDNKKSPFEYLPKSAEIIQLKCPVYECHIWNSTIYTITNGSGCPFCKKKTETKLFNFLISISNEFKVTPQFKEDWCKNVETNRKFVFDFCIDSIKLIFELDGGQHFIQVSNWKSPEENQNRDKHKMKLALENGYTIIRILQEDVWNDTYDWKSLLIKHIKKYDTPQVIYLCQNDEYTKYKEDFPEISSIYSQPIDIKPYIPEMRLKPYIPEIKFPTSVIPYIPEMKLKPYIPEIKFPTSVIVEITETKTTTEIKTETTITKTIKVYIPEIKFPTEVIKL